MPDRDEDAVVSYTVRELIDQFRRETHDNFARVFARLDETATRAELEALRVTVHTETTTRQALDGRVRALEDHRESQAAHTQWRAEWRRWFVPVILSTVMVAVMILQFMIGGTPRG